LSANLNFYHGRHRDGPGDGSFFKPHTHFPS
jgi:hypothetical protein